MLIWLKFIVAFLQPPGLNILLCLMGLYYWIRSSLGMAAVFFIGSATLLYLLSIPTVSNPLLATLEYKYQSSTLDALITQKEPKAIVVLLAGSDPSDSLIFSQYAAKIAKATTLPILVSGNSVSLDHNPTNEAAFMARSLVSDFNITGVIWIENGSLTTRESAKLSKPILDQNAIKNVFLITNAWHMSKAIAAFKKQGIDVVPAPILTPLKISKSKLTNFTPTAACLLRSGLFFKEYLEEAWSKALDLLHH